MFVISYPCRAPRGRIYYSKFFCVSGQKTERFLPMWNCPFTVHGASAPRFRLHDLLVPNIEMASSHNVFLIVQWIQLCNADTRTHTSRHPAASAQAISTRPLGCSFPLSSLHFLSTCRNYPAKYAIDHHVLAKRPRNSVQIFGRENGPDKQMFPQHGARRHHCKNTNRREQRQSSKEVELAEPTEPSRRLNVGSKYKGCCRGPPNRARPVTNKR